MGKLEFPVATFDDTGGKVWCFAAKPQMVPASLLQTGANFLKEPLTESRRSAAGWGSWHENSDHVSKATNLSHQAKKNKLAWTVFFSKWLGR
jgi:hypothetical protein